MVEVDTLAATLAASDELGLAARLLCQSLQHGRLSDYLSAALPLLVEAAGADYAVVAVAEAGRWSKTAEAGSVQPLPVELLAEAADRDEIASDKTWTAAPLLVDAGRSIVLAVHGTDPKGRAADSRSTWANVAAVLALASRSVHARHRTDRRERRLVSILEIAQQWNRTNELQPLLTQMAEAATRLLEADRATIFLWDKPGKTLVGRPALGVEGNELRIADDTGVVGQVVHSGEPRRVAGSEADEIARDVDAKLGYRTRNLVCVPLQTVDGRRLGAFEVLNKLQGDFTSEDEEALSELGDHASIALENTRQFQQLLTTHRQIVDQAAEGVQILGNCPAIEALRATVDRVAETDLAVLVLGENGTGKEVLCRTIHYRSRRRTAPFIAVNCAALAETLLESELFGHEKGAFTDAHESRAGKFELATGGTLFLDEIGDMSLSGQAKLLRVLEEKLVVRVGGSAPIHTDVRVLAATNQNLAQRVSEKKFREDLYFRLNVITLDVPPLGERGDDVVLLAETFLDQFCKEAGHRTPKLSAAARRRLLAHRWPGNVRELRNLMERLAYLLPEQSGPRTIAAEDLAFVLSPASTATSISSDLPLTDATRQFQIDFIQGAIHTAGGNMSDAAERLGLHRANLYRKMKQLGMEM